MASASLSVELLLDEADEWLSCNSNINDNNNRRPRPVLIPPDFTLPPDYDEDTPEEWMHVQEDLLEGLGWFASKDIPRGTLLNCSKPIAMVMDWQDTAVSHEEEEEEEEPFSTLSKLNELLLLKVLQRISEDPTLWTNIITHLFPRTNDQVESLLLREQQQPATYTGTHNETTWISFTSEHILAEYEDCLNEIDLPQQQLRQLDQRLPLIVKYNVTAMETFPEQHLLACNNSFSGTTASNTTTTYASLSGCALFDLGISYFNHSSHYPNATKCSIGDVLWVVANQNVPKGTQIKISYLQPSSLCAEREQVRTHLIDMDFRDDGNDTHNNAMIRREEEEESNNSPLEPVVTPYYQYEIMNGSPTLRLQVLKEMLQQTWHLKTDAQTIRLMLVSTLEELTQLLNTTTTTTINNNHGQEEEEDDTILQYWQESIEFYETHVPTNSDTEQALVLLFVRAALCAYNATSTTTTTSSSNGQQALEYAQRAVTVHSNLLGGGVARFRRCFQQTFQQMVLLRQQQQQQQRHNSEIDNDNNNNDATNIQETINQLWPLQE